MQAAITELSGLGFSDTESRAYTHLLFSGPATGYQLARSAGIARPNIYPILDRLEARGAVIRIQGDAGQSRYEAMPAARMLEHIAGETRRRISGAKAAFASLQPPPATSDSVWNLEGRDAVLGRARELIDASKASLLAGLWALEAEDLGDALADAVRRGVHVTTLCIQGWSTNATAAPATSTVTPSRAPAGRGRCCWSWKGPACWWHSSKRARPPAASTQASKH